MVRFSAKLEYGILAIMELGLQPEHSPVQAKVIAKSQNIPPRFLEQILANLRKAGLVESLRGAQGGYALSKPPNEIRLTEILEAVEGPTTPFSARAASGEKLGVPDSDTARGVFDPIWDEVQTAVFGVLESVSVEDLLTRKREKERQQALMYHI